MNGLNRGKERVEEVRRMGSWEKIRTAQAATEKTCYATKLGTKMGQMLPETAKRNGGAANNASVRLPQSALLYPGTRYETLIDILYY